MIFWYSLKVQQNQVSLIDSQQSAFIFNKKDAQEFEDVTKLQSAKRQRELGYEFLR